MTKYTNKALSIEEQIIRLKSSGLIIDNEQEAHKVLSIISYFRLACYWRPMELDKSSHQFKPNSKFEGNDIALDPNLRSIK